MTKRKIDTSVDKIVNDLTVLPLDEAFKLWTDDVSLSLHPYYELLCHIADLPVDLWTSDSLEIFKSIRTAKKCRHYSDTIIKKSVDNVCKRHIAKRLSKRLIDTQIADAYVMARDSCKFDQSRLSRLKQFVHDYRVVALKQRRSQQIEAAILRARSAQQINVLMDNDLRYVCFVLMSELYAVDPSIMAAGHNRSALELVLNSCPIDCTVKKNELQRYTSDEDNEVLLDDESIETYHYLYRYVKEKAPVKAANNKKYVHITALEIQQICKTLYEDQWVVEMLLEKLRFLKSGSLWYALKCSIRPLTIVNARVFNEQLSQRINGDTFKAMLPRLEQIIIDEENQNELHSKRRHHNS
jgi:hypothetical protein